MDTPNKNMQLVMKKVKSPNFIYLSIFFVFVAIVVVLFILSTNFIVLNINKIFSPTNDGVTKALDMNSYSLVAKRLDLPVNVATDRATTSPAFQKQVATSTTQQTALRSLSINIFNSTAKKGVASALATTLEKDGFAKAHIANQKKSIPVTTIVVIDSKKEFFHTVETSVKKIYPKAILSKASGSETTDITIVIGEE